jgi:hypothetical protein
MCELQDAQHFLAELQVDYEDMATDLTQQVNSYIMHRLACYTAVLSISREVKQRLSEVLYCEDFVVPHILLTLLITTAGE